MRHAVSLAAALWIAAGAAADAPADPDAGLADPGPYLTALGVAAFPTASEGAFAEQFVQGDQRAAEVDPAYGLDARAGWRLAERVALEGAFLWLAERDYESVERASGGLNRGRARLWSATGHVKYFVLTRRLQPYLLFGAGWAEQRSRIRSGPQAARDRTRTRGDSVVRLAAGLDWALDRDVSAGFELGYWIADGDLSASDQLTLSLGLTLRFYAGD